MKKRPEWIVRCECGTYYTLHFHTVCPTCFLYPKAEWISNGRQP
jgi:hypothetical protein